MLSARTARDPLFGKGDRLILHDEDGTGMRVPDNMRGSEPTARQIDGTARRDALFDTSDIQAASLVTH